MKQQTRIFLVRHGESEHNVRKLISGQSNPGLTAKGREQAVQARELLKDIEFDVVYSSPLDRASETAEIIIGRAVPLESRLDDLKERHFGSLDSMPEAHLTEGRVLQAKMTPEDSWHFKHVEDMESDHEVSLRFTSALERLVEKHPGSNILIVAHGGAIRTTILRLNGLNNRRFSESGSIKNADVIELGYSGGELKALRLNGESM